MSIFRSCLALAAMTSLIVACSDSTSPSGRDVTVRFAITGGASSSLATAAQVNTGALEVTGTNGTLEIDRIAFIVSRVEFEQEEDACEFEHEEDGNRAFAERSGEGENGEEDEACEEFRLAPSFVNLSLPGGVVTVATAELPDGNWTQLKFRVKNIDFDDDDDDDEIGDLEEQNEDRGLSRLLETARGAFPDWPNKASLVVSGSFRPAGSSETVPFTTFFDGEIKVKMPLQPPLVVTEAGASREVVIELDPARWFKSFDGRVIDLSASDFRKTHQLVFFRLKMREGFLLVRFDD
jgi:hypothetical protein